MVYSTYMQAYRNGDYLANPVVTDTGDILGWNICNAHNPFSVEWITQVHLLQDAIELVNDLASGKVKQSLFEAE